MKRLLIACALMTGCGAAEQAGDPPKAPQGDTNTAASQSEPPAVAGRQSSLTGLYEGARTSQTDQLCMIEKEPGSAQFGLVIWGANLHSCSGSGTATRQGETLRLEMAGDEACRIDAKLSGGKVSLPEAIPAGCDYYCGARARMAGAALTRSGSTPDDAMKAKDLVGEPLCTR